MLATVAMPWRPTGDRLGAYDRITRFWAHFGFDVVCADSDPGAPFHRAEARNNACARCHTDTVIFADADTLPDIGAVMAAIAALDDGHGVVYPHTSYRHIPGEWVDRIDLMLARPVTKEYRNSDGGVFVTTKKTYWSVGGMDERLNPVWGYEDSCFSLAARTLSSVKRLPGVMISFDHAVEGNRLMGDNANRSRYLLYQLCAGRPELMDELIKR